MNFTPTAQVRDLERLLDSLDLERAALIGVLHAGSIAPAFAAAHPDRVSHLLLWHGYVRGTDMFRDSRMSAVAELIQMNWELFTDAVTFTNFGWTAGASAGEFAELARAAVTPETGRIAFADFARYDLAAELGRITAPTLVLSREAPLAPNLDVARELDVLALLSAGRSNQQIAEDLSVSVGTVKTHVSNILMKLQATNRTEAVARARAAELIR